MLSSFFPIFIFKAAIIENSVSERKGIENDVSVIAGKEFRNWVLGVKKRRINNVSSFTPIPVTTARLKAYNVYPDIDAHGARDEMCRYRQGRHRDNRSKELRPTGRQKKKDQESRSRQERQKDKTSGGGLGWMG
ncbi:hypothetical protein TNCV_449991 [Trichonephila clavipes]|nr:hypothetical protein TNCV_449991 [Trichonephila clavipes]